MLVLLPLLMAALAVLYVVISALNTHRPVTYLINLRSIENQRYPNGTAFTPHDLIIPQALSEIRRRFQLPSDADLRRAISVTYDSPVAAGITQNYRNQLAARNLTTAEIAAINEAYQRELAAAMQSSLRINVDYMALGADGPTGLSIARAVPEIWTDIYTTQFRIFVDTRLADLATTLKDEDLKTTSSVLAANSRVAAMRQGIELLLSDNRLSMLQTEEGESPADLRERLRGFETTFFNPIRARGFQSGDAVATGYLTDLRLTIAEIKRRVDAHEQTLAELREYQRGDETMTAQRPTDGGNAVQVGDTALAEIVDLAKRASLSDFVQETLRNRNELLYEVSDLTRELEFAANKVEAQDTPAFRQQAAEALKDLTGRYSELAALARTHLQARTGILYEPVLGPLISSPLLSARSILVVGAAGLAGVILAVAIILIWSAIGVAGRQTRQS